MTPEALATLLSDPSRADSLPREELPAVLGKVEQLRAALWARITTPETAQAAKPASDIERVSGDRMLTADEAAPRLGLDKKALYRRADRLPFTRRLGPRTLRFSEQGLETWLANQ